MQAVQTVFVSSPPQKASLMVMSITFLLTCKFVEDYDYGHDDGDTMQ